jgi:hypothetical protein
MNEMFESFTDENDLWEVERAVNERRMDRT